MKKCLFSVMSSFVLFAYQANAQQATMTVKRNTDVKIMNGALLYVDGDMKIESGYNNSARKVSNEGNVKITQKLVNENTTGAYFVNEYVSAGKYGQLIINSSESQKNSGKISSGVKFNRNSNFQIVAVPYKGVKVGDFVKEAFGGSGDISSAFVNYVGGGRYQRSRYKNPFFYWNNGTYTLDGLGKEDMLNNPEREYVISTFSKLGTLKNNVVSHLSGTPSKDDITVQVKGYVPSSSRSTNKFGEFYGSYIADFTLNPPTDWGNFSVKKDVENNNKYGANIFHFGNPYTSNIDLAKGEGFVGNNVKAIYQVTNGNNYEEGQAASKRVTAVSSSVVTVEGAGDPANCVRPFHGFYVKLKDGVQSHTFKFKNDMKVFDTPTGDVANVLFQKNSSDMPVINQVGLDLYDDYGFTGAKTYVVASDVYEAAQKGMGTEIRNIAMNDDVTGIYTLQENEDGSVNEELSDFKAYINGVNADKYVGKPIHLAFQNGEGRYTLKARLNESLEKNKNAFYFEDKVTGKVIKIGKDFEYSFDIKGTDKDRFVLYWASTPNNVSVDEAANEETNVTVVYKDFNIYKVRFDKSIKKADVFIYNISGQLINSAKSVDATVDYMVPLKGNAGVYILRIVGDNGKVTTKKIIK